MGKTTNEMERGFNKLKAQNIRVAPNFRISDARVKHSSFILERIVAGRRIPQSVCSRQILPRRPF